MGQASSVRQSGRSRSRPIGSMTAPERLCAPHFRSFLDDDDEIGRELLQTDGRGQSRGPGADDHDVELHRIARGQFAPSDSDQKPSLHAAKLLTRVALTMSVRIWTRRELIDRRRGAAAVRLMRVLAVRRQEASSAQHRRECMSIHAPPGRRVSPGERLRFEAKQQSLRAPQRMSSAIVSHATRSSLPPSARTSQ